MAMASPWQWEARPDVWLLVASIVIGYYWSESRLRLRLPGPPPAARKSQRRRFLAGTAVLWMAVDWPLDRLGDDYLFSAHMVQFVVVTMIAVPLLLSGTPVWLQAEIAHPIAKPLARLRSPLALVQFQVVLVATHLPSVVATYTSNEFVHFGLHVLWVASAFLFWLPVLGDARLIRPLPHLGKVVYLILATIVPTIPASFLTWAEKGYYASYVDAPRVWGITPIEDLQMAGAIMKLGGGFILWGFVVWAFLSAASDDESASGPARRAAGEADSAEGLIRPGRRPAPPDFS